MVCNLNESRNMHPLLLKTMDSSRNGNAPLKQTMMRVVIVLYSATGFKLYARLGGHKKNSVVNV